jgi:uncharacterized small protein (DUF1192 family)
MRRLLGKLDIDSKRSHVKICYMEADENLPLRRDDPLAILVRQDLDPLSVNELEERIANLKSEISRCEGKIAFATRHRSTADALFRK